MKFKPYVRNGLAKQLKTKLELKFGSFEEKVMKASDELALDGNLAVADFEKMQNSLISHVCFLALDKFRAEEKRDPKVWNLEDAKKFVDFARAFALDSKVEKDDLKDESEMVRLFYLFSF